MARNKHNTLEKPLRLPGVAIDGRFGIPGDINVRRLAIWINSGKSPRSLRGNPEGEGRDGPVSGGPMARYGNLFCFNGLYWSLPTYTSV